MSILSRENSTEMLYSSHGSMVRKPLSATKLIEKLQIVSLCLMCVLLIRDLLDGICLTFIVLDFNFRKNHLEDHIVEKTDLPDELVRDVTGQLAFEEENSWVSNYIPPITPYSSDLQITIVCSQ